MRAVLEIAVFGTLAVFIHAAGFAVTPEKGEQASGDQGEFLVSLQGSSAQLEALVETWTEAPEIGLEVPEIELTQPDIGPLPSALNTFALLPSPDPVVALPSLPNIQEPQPEKALDDSITKPAERSAPVDVLKRADPELKGKNPKARPVQKAKPKAKTKKKKQAASDQRNQKAAGQGGQSNAGAAGTSTVKTGTKASAAKALNVWGAQVRRSIERRKKSVRGLKRRARVTVSVTVAANGQIMSYRVSKSSGNKKADNAALRAVNSAGRMPKAVKGVAVRKHTFHVPMIFNP